MATGTEEYVEETDATFAAREGVAMKILRILSLLFTLTVVCVPYAGIAAQNAPVRKVRLLVVSSYHREYIWTKETNRGFCDAMLKTGYFDNSEQAAEFTRSDTVETAKAVVKKVWMDTKRKRSTEDIARSTASITKTIGQFKPDLLLLGDDNAANYIGNQFLDTSIPIVFWGVNSTPLKYGLLDTMERPGHNVTGVYQPGYIVEGIHLLKTLMPKAKSLAILSDESETGRANYKAVEYLARKGILPLRLVETAATSSFTAWKEKALELQKKADAFFIGHYASLQHPDGSYVTPEEAVRWYITNIRVPEVMTERQFVEQGILCTADDSGYKQGYEAVLIADDILARGAKPATYPPRAPKRGALIVNKQRARMLGISLSPDIGIEEYIEEASVLEEAPK
jgi:ABC-type uncharacterized transport system substrate-binding protein